jgi:hypothetical protein
MATTVPSRPASQREFIELHFENQDGKVRVAPADRDMLVMSVNSAVEACRAYRDQIVFNDQFHLLLSRLGQWVRERAAKIANAFLTTRDDGILFLIVMKEKQFDGEFEEELTQLDIDIANDGDFALIRLSVHAVPNCTEDEFRSFLASKAIRFNVDGERESSH